MTDSEEESVPLGKTNKRRWSTDSSESSISVIKVPKTGSAKCQISTLEAGVVYLCISLCYY